MVSICIFKRQFTALNYTRLLSSNKLHIYSNTLKQHQGLSMKDIIKVDTTEKLAEALKDLTSQTVLGFDTESKPNFIGGKAGQRLGPHLIQLSTLHIAYLFPIPNRVCENTSVDDLIQMGLRAILQSYNICKVGFGIMDDGLEIKRKLGIEVNSLLDLGKTLWDWEDPDRNQRTISTKAGVLRYLNADFKKSKWVSTSNWGLPLQQYTNKMILYAGNDAHAALLVYNAWFETVERGKYATRWVDNYCSETWQNSKHVRVPDEFKRMYAPPDCYYCR